MRIRDWCSDVCSSDLRLPGPLKLLPAAFGMPFFHPLSLMDGNRAVFGVNVGHLWDEVDKIRGWMTALLQGVADGWVRPHVDQVFSFAQAGEAQTYIEARRNIGKRSEAHTSELQSLMRISYAVFCLKKKNNIT